MTFDRRLLAAMLTVGVALTGCGGDTAETVADGTSTPAAATTTDEPDEADEEDAGSLGRSYDADEPSTSDAPAATDEPIASEEPAPDGACDRDPRDVQVTATNFAFDTDAIEDVCAGDTITFEVAEGSHSFTSNAAGVDTGVFASSDDPRTETVDAEPGTYRYVCSLHGQMTGELTVVG